MSSEGFFKVNQIDSGELRLVYFPSPRGLYIRPTRNCPCVSANSLFPGRRLGKNFLTDKKQDKRKKKYYASFLIRIHLIPELLTFAVQEYKCNNKQTLQDDSKVQTQNILKIISIYLRSKIVDLFFNVLAIDLFSH